MLLPATRCPEVCSYCLGVGKIKTTSAPPDYSYMEDGQIKRIKSCPIVKVSVCIYCRGSGKSGDYQTKG